MCIRDRANLLRFQRQNVSDSEHVQVFCPEPKGPSLLVHERLVEKQVLHTVEGSATAPVPTQTQNRHQDSAVVHIASSSILPQENWTLREQPPTQDSFCPWPTSA